MPEGSHPLSLSYYTVPELSFLELIDVAAKTGCSQVGVRLLDGAPEGPPTALLNSAAMRREALAALRDQGLSVLEASAARLRPATRVAHFTPFVAACAELAVSQVMCTIDDPDSARAEANLDALCRLCGSQGLRVAIEFVPWMTVGSLSSAAQLVRRLGHSNLGIAVDALHFDRSHSSLTELRELPAAWLPFLQLCDAPPCQDYSTEAQIHVATQERLFPGEGIIDLEGLVRAMPADVPLGLEIPTAQLATVVPAWERVARAVAATRALLQKITPR